MEAPQAVQLRRLCTAPAERLCPRATWWAVDREISSCISVRESPTLHREINNILKIKVVCCFLVFFFGPESSLNVLKQTMKPPTQPYNVQLKKTLTY